MRDRGMLMGTRKAIALLSLLALAGLAASGCGSEDGTPTTAKTPPAISAATADQLASLSEQIATDLDAGLTCDAAHAADELNGAVEDADLSANLRPGVEEVASRLVDEVNCPPPEPDPEELKKREEERKKLEDEQRKRDEEQKKHEGKRGPPGHSGDLPPGQAKIKGEAG